MTWQIISGILLLIVIFLIFYKKKRDNIEIEEARHKIELLLAQENDLNKEIQNQQNTILNNLNKIKEVKEEYLNNINNIDDELENYYSNQKQIYEEQLNTEFEARRIAKEETLALQFKQMEESNLSKIENIKNITEKQIAELYERAAAIEAYTIDWEKTYNNLMAPYQLLEKEKMERLFYTIQVPEEYRDDISFLLETVSQKVRHPDIISKLVWQEYVKPYLDETFKRVGIKDDSGIYKLTYIENNKSYVGKSTNIKKRISDHMKSVVGIQSIADQTVHHEILKTGLWNWTIEVVGYFPKEQLSEKEKYYIKEFDCVNSGYNRTGGG